jgi:hypothetical protein
MGRNGPVTRGEAGYRGLEAWSGLGSRVGAVNGSRTGTGHELCWLCTLLLLVGSRLVGLSATVDSRTVAVGELGLVRSPDVGIRRRHGFRDEYEGYNWCGRLRANFLPRLGARTEFFRHRERFTSNFVTPYYYKSSLLFSKNKVLKGISLQ